MTALVDPPKRRAARAALAYVRPGMRLGLGTGSTAREFVALLGAEVAGGLDLVCVATSQATADQARGLNIPVVDIDEAGPLDLAIDGTDEFDPELQLIKGGGGALMREKIVASAAARMIVIADATKRVARLGRFPLPVEIDAFGAQATRRHVARIAQEYGCEGAIGLRMVAPDKIFVTDGGHFILDCALGIIEDPAALARHLQAVPGVVGHGLFIGLASAVLMGDETDVTVFGDPARTARKL